MSKDKLNLNKIDFDSEPVDKDKFRSFLINDYNDNQNYGDDQEEIDSFEREDNPDEIEFQEFEDSGDDEEEILGMEDDVAVIEADLKAMGIEDEFISYRVRISSRTLRYFSGPGVDHDALGYFTKGAVLTIFEEADGSASGPKRWGQTEEKGTNNPFWIPLDYCERID